MFYNTILFIFKYYYFKCLKIFKLLIVKTIKILYLNYNLIESNCMKNLQKYLSTAPVLLTLWMTFTAGFIIEINRFFPDMLSLYF